MQIDIATQLLQYQHLLPVAAPQSAAPQITPSTTLITQGTPQDESLFGPAAVLKISPEGRVAYEASISGDINGGGNTSGIAGTEGSKECQTCKNRKYVDVSDDPSVSFQTPTSINPNAVMSAVAAHEGEHVRNEQMKAENEGRKVVSQTVSIHTSICPECGKVYISGGETRTVTVSEGKTDNNQDGLNQEQYAGIDLFA